MIHQQEKRLSLKVVLVIFITTAFILPGSATVSTTTGNGVIVSDHPLITSTTIYVDDDNTAGPWDGSLEHPYQLIQEAIDNALDGYQIFVFNGTYTEHITIYKSVDIIGERNDITVIDGSGTDTVVKITASLVTLTGFTIKKSGSHSTYAGISLNAQQAMITNNIIRDNYYGIYAASPNNYVFHNNFYDNTYPAYDAAVNTWDAGSSLGGNYWQTYSGTDDNEDGIGDTEFPIPGDTTFDHYPLIHPYGSIVNLDTKEVFLTIQQAIQDSDTLAHHTISVKNGVYYEHIHLSKSLTLTGEDALGTIIDGRGSDTVVSLCADEATLKTCTIQHSGHNENDAGVRLTHDNITVTDTIILDNYQGCLITQHADGNILRNNIIQDNLWNGIFLCHAGTNNLIIENTVKNNRYAGIGVSDSSYNSFYHNSMIANLFNAYDTANNLWDDSYPSGGNFWSDYTGSDADLDGIGDSPYYILDGMNKDRYPLMEPYTGEDTVPPTLKILAPQNGIYLRNHQLFSRILKHQTIIFGKITIQAAATDAQSGVSKVEFYVDDLILPKATLYDPPYEWTWTGHSFLKHSHTIVVVAYDNAGNTNQQMMTVHRFL